MNSRRNPTAGKITIDKKFFNRLKLSESQITMIFFALIILIGIFLRFYKIKTLATFRGDQAMELLAAAKILRGKFTLIGMKTSISEVRNGAVMYYLLAPFLFLLNFDPVAGGVLQSLLSLGAAFFAFLMGRKINWQVGLLAAFFVCTSPTLVQYSRQNLLAYSPLFFETLGLWFLIKIIEKFNGIKVFFLGFLSGFMLQIHYSTIAFIGLCFFAAFFIPLKKRISYFSFLLMGFLIGFLPFLMFEIRHEFFNSKMLLAFLGENTRFSLNGKYFLNYFLTFFSDLLFASNHSFGFIAVFSLAGFYSFFLFKKKSVSLVEKISFLQIVLAVAFVLPFIGEAFVSHYAMALFVPFFILLANFVSMMTGFYFRSKKNKIALGLVCLFFVFLNFKSYRLEENHGATMEEGWSLRGVEKTSQLIRDDVGNEIFNVVMLVDQENQAFPLRYFLYVYEREPLGIEDYGRQPKVLYVVANSKINLEGAQVWEVASFQPFKIANSWSIENGFMLYKLKKT